MIIPPLLTATLCLVTSVAAVQPLVDVGYTKYLGTSLSSGVTQWLGVRFAAPPLGNLRFRAPADPVKNATTQAANQHGPICLATGPSYPTSGQSEDCLFLDVYAPSNATTSSNLPVYFFLTGGGFNEDQNANYNGTDLVRASGNNIIVVTFNYRVGPYGFLASKEVQQNGDLNAGLLDQRKALQWVQDHISQFGGNPGHVVLGGDSAGAISITLHMSAYGGQPTNLFQAVAGESQGFPLQLTVAQSQYQYDALVTRVGCNSAEDTLGCLRSLDISKLQNNNIAIPYPGKSLPPVAMYAPVIDGALVPDYTYKLFSQGKFIKLPAIFGDVTNEGTDFTPKNLSTVQDMDNFLASNYPNLTSTMLNTINTLYPQSKQFSGHGAYYTAGANALGEIEFICPGNYISSAIHNYTNGSINWNYHYNVADPGQVAAGYGVPHISELSAIWGPNNTQGFSPSSYNNINKPIIPVVQGYWTSFIRTFNPNTYKAAGTPTWQPFGSNQTRILFEVNNTRLETVPDDQKTRCSYLSSISLAIQQ